MINPELLCKQHLLGEHFEIHVHRHNFVKQHSVRGRVFPVVQIEIVSMQSRHDELVKEMIRRGMNHKSEYIMPDISYLPKEILELRVDKESAMKDLYNRCKKCEERGLTL